MSPFLPFPDMEFLHGAIDIHIHPGPDLYARLQDNVELARTAQRGVSGNLILVNRSVEIRTVSGLPSHLTTLTSRCEGSNKRTARPMR